MDDKELTDKLAELNLRFTETGAALARTHDLAAAMRQGPMTADDTAEMVTLIDQVEAAYLTTRAELAALVALIETRNLN